MDHVEADVAFLPIGGTYTMASSEAAGAAIAIGPKTVIPIALGRHRGIEAGCEATPEALRREGERGDSEGGVGTENVKRET